MSRGLKEPELLAPAGNWECARAAVANGADAIYFGLPRFNARMRAENFTEEDLPELMRFLHGHGVRGFAAFNTLIFTGELDEAITQLRQIQEAGVDAVIVQDLGLARLVREVAPGLELHASTQMTITSLEGLRFLDSHFRLDRAVLARENSLREIRLFHAAEGGDMAPLEVFVHGALCVAYSGQCLTSESLGQRSANRGECAQACRMPYELVVDGETVDLGDRRYPLSPQDLAGYEEIPELLKLGVRSFKIEGRLKSPEYVAAVTRVYRKALDEAVAGRDAGAGVGERERYELEMAFSRGLYSGWLRGIDNRALVHGEYAKKRGAYLGKVSRTGKGWVEVRSEVPLAAGDGVVFETGGDTDHEEGGRIFGIEGDRLTFGKGGPDLRRVREGQRVWKTDDPRLNAELRSTWQGDLHRKRPGKALRWTVTGRAGEPLRLRDEDGGLAVESEMALQKAEARPLERAFLREKLGKLGGTPYELGDLRVELEGDLILPVSELNRMRRRLVGMLTEREAAGAVRRAREVDWRALARPGQIPGDTAEAELSVLCRTEEQVESVLGGGVGRIYADFEDVRRYADLGRQVGGRVELFLATPRIQKAGEAGLFKLVERAGADGVLVRNLGGVAYFRGHPELRMAGDFSLNVANPLSADLLMGEGFSWLTISYDLNLGQVLDLLAAAPPSWFELTLHQHMPMFHMEHCVFCRFLSTGTDATNCGRPCEKHRVELRDRVGQNHPLTGDVGCRNTLFNGRAQSGARFLPRLLDAGLRRFRVELLREGAEETRRVIRTYQQLLEGSRTADEVWDALRAESRLGVVESR